MKKVEIKVLIADDHDLIRQGLRTIVNFEEDLNISGEAENGEKALNMFKLYRPDVVLLDVNMPVISGIEVLRAIKQHREETKVIMLTIENDRKTIHTAIDIGADGYVLKDSTGTEIVKAIRTVCEGEKYIDKSLVALLFSDIKTKDKKNTSVLDSLSRRELEVLIRISKGFSNKEIGKQLYLSEKTVKNYATNLFRKINVADRVQATILAIEHSIDEHYKLSFGSEE
jgi:two-component system, NarL family, response regulator DegU